MPGWNRHKSLKSIVFMPRPPRVVSGGVFLLQAGEQETWSESVSKGEREEKKLWEEKIKVCAGTPEQTRLLHHFFFFFLAYFPVVWSKVEPSWEIRHYLPWKPGLKLSGQLLAALLLLLLSLLLPTSSSCSNCSCTPHSSSSTLPPSSLWMQITDVSKYETVGDTYRCLLPHTA